MTPGSRLVGWLFPSAPPERLAVLRILVGTFGWIYVVVQTRAFLSLTSSDATGFEPVGVLGPLSGPLPDAALVACYVIALLAGLGYVAGVWFRLCGPAFGLSLLVLCTYRSSWGQLLWFENVMVLHVLIVGFARSADARAWSPRRHRPTSLVMEFRRAAAPSETYGAPVRLAALVTVATYVLAALAKLRLSGIEWITTDSLRHHVAATYIRADLLGLPASPVGRWLVGQDWLFTPMAAASVAIELAAPVALAGRRLRDGWVALAWLMHLSIALMMFVVFPYPLFLVAFAPLYDLERVAVRCSKSAPGPATCGLPSTG